MRKWKKLFATPKSKLSDPFYDMYDEGDWRLIEASFAQQYGIRLRRDDMSYDEFCSLLSGLKHDTPLGNIVSIRSETDKDILKHFTPEQKRIRSEWLNKRSKDIKNIDMEQYNKDMKMFEDMFRGLAKVGGK